MAAPRIILLGTAVSVVASYVVLACSSPNTGTLTGGPGTYEQTGNPKKKDGGAPKADSGARADGGGSPSVPDPPSPKSDGGGATNACAASTTKDECSQCCDEQNPTAVDAWAALWDACVCAPAACATQCATSYCAAGGGDAPTAECSDCIAQSTNTCTAQAYAKCPGDAACAPLTACEAASQCKNKP